MPTKDSDADGSEDMTLSPCLDKCFNPFLPLGLRKMLSLAGDAPTDLPQHQSVLGCVLIADISGFTKLGEKLRNRYGEGEGAAKLAHDIDTVLSEFIMCVYAYGGDIIKFAGDAIICVFLGDEKDRVNDPAKYMKDR